MFEKLKKNLYYYKGKVGIPPLAMMDDLNCASKCGIKSVLMNAFINAKTNMKKLQFDVENERYLGDILSINGSNKNNILARRNKGIGVINQILAILDGTCYGPHIFEVGLLLRESIAKLSLNFN